MSCQAVRERLPERALALLEPDEMAETDRHLDWCAGCRKEAAELEHSAATLGLASRAVPPPDELEDRVVWAVRSAAGAARPGRHRGRRAAGAAVIAAFVAVAGLGWGAVMAGRADRFRVRAQIALSQRDLALRRFESAINALPPLGPRPSVDSARMGRLSPVPGHGASGAGGTALLVGASASASYGFVIVDGLDPKLAGALPYRVSLVDGTGRTISVGRVRHLDSNGGAQVLHRFAGAMSGFTRVMVRNAAGREVLEGTVSAPALPPTP